MVDKVIVSFVDSMQQNQITLCKKKKFFTLDSLLNEKQRSLTGMNWRSMWRKNMLFSINAAIYVSRALLRQ
jgi:hypothetical protein